MSIPPPKNADGEPNGHAGPQKQLSAPALRALAEAHARRAALKAKSDDLVRNKELGGREGPDPVRYLDWENNGIASDF